MLGQRASSMPSTFSCPKCGAPLSSQPAPSPVACRYCRHEIVLREQRGAALAKEAPERSDADRPPSVSRRSRRRTTDTTRRGIVIGVGIVSLALTAGVLMLTRRSSQQGAEEELPSEVTLRKIDLGAAPAAIAELLGNDPDATQRITRDFEKGIVRRAEVQWDKADGSHASKVTLFFRPGRFERRAALERLASIVPNRVEPQGASNHRLFVGDTDLDISSDTLTVSHWTSVHPAGIDRTACGERRAAFWAAARFAVLDGPSLTPAQVEMVNGPALRAVLRLDRALTVEQVTGKINDVFPAGRCFSQTGVICQVDVDHPLVREVLWRWPNAVKGRLREATLALRAHADAVKTQRAVAGCLQPILGAGDESVTDYVKGTRTWTWNIGKQGDQATLTAATLRLSEPEDAKPDAPATWPERFAGVIDALDRCSIPGVSEPGEGSR